MTLDVKKSNSSNETPNVMTVGVEKYGLRILQCNVVNTELSCWEFDVSRESDFN
jgi:hypothetical protein